MGRKSRRQALQVGLEMHERGIPVDGRVVECWATSCAGLSVHQSGWILDSEIFDLDSGGAGCMLNVTITNHSSRFIRLLAFRLEMPWLDADFRWIEPPWRKTPRGHTYDVPGSRLVGIEPEEVLNHQVGAKGILLPGVSLDGLLLGVFGRPMPKGYRDRTRLPPRLSIFDTNENEYSTSINALASRFRGTRVPKFARLKLAKHEFQRERT